MPEVTVNIYSRSYRLAVSTGEEALIQRCADIVDKQMKAIREGGKVINQDQIAVLAALEVAYEANKNVQKNSTDAQRSAAEKDAEIARLKARIAELESRPAPVAAPLQASGPGRGDHGGNRAPLPPVRAGHLRKHEPRRRPLTPAYQIATTSHAAAQIRYNEFNPVAVSTGLQCS